MSDDLNSRDLALLNQISDSLVTLNRRMEASEGIQRATLERLVRLEERSNNAAKVEDHINKVEENVTARLNSHSERIQALEASNHRLQGASGVVDMLNKLWPIFAAVFGVMGLIYGFSG